MKTPETRRSLASHHDNLAVQPGIASSVLPPANFQLAPDIGAFGSAVDQLPTHRTSIPGALPLTHFRLASVINLRPCLRSHRRLPTGSSVKKESKIRPPVHASAKPAICVDRSPSHSARFSGRLTSPHGRPTPAAGSRLCLQTGQGIAYPPNGSLSSQCTTNNLVQGTATCTRTASSPTVYATPSLLTTEPQ